MRVLFYALGFYFVALAVVDTLTFNGQYRKAVWQETSYRAAQVGTEVSSLLQKIGI